MRRWEEFLAVAAETVVEVKKLTGPEFWPVKNFDVRFRKLVRSPWPAVPYAYYAYSTYSIFISQDLLDLPEADWRAVLLHELAHHVQHIKHKITRTRLCMNASCAASIEACATACENQWGVALKLEKTVSEWNRYIEGRSKLDTAVNVDRSVTTPQQARALLVQAGVPLRLIREEQELLRVKDTPGDVQGYVNGDVRLVPHCPCNPDQPRVRTAQTHAQYRPVRKRCRRCNRSRDAPVVALLALAVIISAIVIVAGWAMVRRARLG